MSTPFVFDARHFDGEKWHDAKVRFWKEEQELEVAGEKDKTCYVLEDICVEARIIFKGKQYELLSWGDDFTREKLAVLQEKTLAMIKPDATGHLGAILERIEEAGFHINHLLKTQWRDSDADKFYEVHVGKFFYPELKGFMTSGPPVGMELVGEGAIKRWRDLIGPTNSDKARVEAPDCLRALYGADFTHNATHGSDANETAAAESAVWKGLVPNTQTLMGSVCVVHPLMVRKKNLGKIVSDVQAAGLKVTAIRMVYLNKEEACALLTRAGMGCESCWEGLSAGPCVAMEVVGSGGAAGTRLLLDRVCKGIREKFGPGCVLYNTKPGVEGLAEQEAKFFFEEKHETW